MKISQQVIVKRWKPILEEYEKIQNKVLHPSLPLGLRLMPSSSYLK